MSAAPVPDSPRTLPTTEQDLHELVATLNRQPVKAAEAVRAAIYTRKSRIEPGAVHYSMEVQPDRAEELVKSRHWQVVDIYADPHKTGRNSRRDGLQRLILDIKTGKVDVVVVHRLDRLYRNLEALLKFIRLLKKYRVRLVSVTEQIDTDSPWGRLVTYVMGALAEMFIWQTSERTRESKAARMRSGLANGNAPLGYCNGLCSTCTDPNGPGYCPDVGLPNRGDGRVPVLHPIDSYSVRLMFRYYQQGMSFKDIANTLNAHNFELPNDKQVHFRTKGIPGQFPPGPFTRDSLRAILQNPFYAGMVARYLTAPLDMEDDPENPHKRKASQANSLGAPQPPAQPGGKRHPIELQQGRHPALLPLQEWKTCQQVRQGKRPTAFTPDKPKRVYELTGVAYCWECHERGIPNASLRGSTGGKDTEYYRCATLHDQYKFRGKPDPEMLAELLPASGLNSMQPVAPGSFLKAHHALRADQLIRQVDALVSRLRIPEEWYDPLLAYHLDADGMARFERERYNMQQEMERLRTLYRLGHLPLADFQAQSQALQTYLDELKPSARPEVRPFIPLLQDFPGLWKQCSPEARRSLLGCMFAGLYFDGQGKLRWVQAYEPFDRLLGVDEGEKAWDEDVVILPPR